MSDAAQRVHGTLVAVDAAGLLIIGASGQGKSSLALDLIALGAELVADDTVEIAPRDAALWGSAPVGSPSLIEARHLGLLQVPRRDGVAITAVADLDHPEPDRLPPARSLSLAGVQLPLLLTPPGGHSASGLLLFLRYGRHP